MSKRTTDVISVSSRHSLVTRMAALFFFLALLLTASQYVVFRYFWTNADEEATQKLHWSIASELTPRIQPYLELPRGDSEVLREKFAELQRLYPQYDVYALNADGFVVESALDLEPEERHPLHSEPVDVAVLEKALTPAVDRRFPIYGRNFDGSDRKVLFSAARIKYFGKPGYLYVILEGTNALALGRAIETSYVVRGLGLVSLALFCLVFGLGVFLSRGVVARFRNFISGVEQIGQGIRGTRVEIAGNDEIALLGVRINSMANEIEENIDKLQRTDTWRREMTAALSHDLKGPIASLSAHIEQLSRLLGDSSETVEQKLDVLQRNTSTLKRYVDDILELSRLEAGEVVPTIVPFLIREMLEEELHPRFLAIAETKAISLTLSYDPALEIVYADPELISRALANLIANAIQYTSDGGEVVIACRLDKVGAYLQISDNGPGFGTDSVEKLLQPFARGDAARSKNNPGTGLGLAIVSSIVRAHGQELQIESVPGSGTSIGFYLSTSKEAVLAARPLRVGVSG